MDLVIHNYVINSIDVSLRMRIERIGKSNIRGKDRDECEEMCEGHFKCKNQAKHFMYPV